MKTHAISLLFGFMFVAVGFLGFTPNPLIGHEGFFAVNTAHNLIHILTGSIFLVGTFRYPNYSGRIIKIVGISYVAVSILGFLTPGNMMLGIVYINEADRWLHLVLAIVILVAGFIFSGRNPGSDAYSVYR